MAFTSASVTLSDVFDAIRQKWDGDNELTTSVSGGLYRGEVPENQEAPFCIVAQSPGGSVRRDTGTTSIEQIGIEFTGVVFAGDAEFPDRKADRIAAAIIRVFDRASIYLKGQPFIEFERTAPELVETTETGAWTFTVQFNVTFNRLLNPT